MPFRGSRTQQQVREDQARSPTPQQIQAEERLDRFAELLSQGLDLDVIAQRMGVRRARVGQLLVIIRKRMGRQAA